MSQSAQFLEKLRASSKTVNPITVLTDDWAGFRGALDTDPEGLGRLLDDDAASAPTGPAFVNPKAFASAACDSDGMVVLADEAFTAWALPHNQSQAELGPLTRGRASVSYLIEDRGKFIAVAAAPLARARGWPLAPEVRACLTAGRAAYAVVAHIARASASHSIAAQVFQLTGLEARVTGGLLEGGDVPAAARLAGVGYETARDAVKSAMRKAGVKRQAEYVSLCVRLEAGEGARGGAITPLLGDLFGLNARQSAIALASVSGLTRAEVARVIGVSENIVKSDLRAVFDACLVHSIGGLSVVVGQLEVLAGLASASDVDLVLPSGRGSEPLRLLPRSQGRTGRIAFADHGPVGGLPTLMMHSATSGRHQPTSLIKALQEGGLRPIALDRPGFGLSDMIEGDYIEQSAQDLVEVMDALELDRASLICRGGARVLAAFAARHPSRLRSAVVVNAEPPPSRDKTFFGILGQTKRLTYTQPWLIQAFGRMLSQHASTTAIEGVLAALVKDNPVDRATVADPEFRSSFVRATRQAALQGGAGPIAVQTSELQHLPPALDNSARITLVYGAADSLFDASDSIPHWRTCWPDCHVVMLPDAGRFALYQRPDVVIASVRGEPVSV